MEELEPGRRGPGDPAGEPEVTEELLEKMRAAAEEQPEIAPLYPPNLAMARHDAIQGITDQLFGHVTGETGTTPSTGELEITINPQDVVKMVDATLISLDGRGAVRPKQGITPPDIANFVDHAIRLFKETEFIDEEREGQ